MTQPTRRRRPARAPRRRGVERPDAARAAERRRRPSTARGRRGTRPARGRGRRAACLTLRREEVREQIRVPSRPRGEETPRTRTPRGRRATAEARRRPPVPRRSARRGDRGRRLAACCHIWCACCCSRACRSCGALLSARRRRASSCRVLRRALGARRLLALGARVLGARRGSAPARQHLGEGAVARLAALRRPQGQVGGKYRSHSSISERVNGPGASRSGPCRPKDPSADS